MRDLQSNFVRQHAAHWERLALELGLKDYHIANISENNVRHPRKVEVCCVAVLEQWLKEIPSPTWRKLNDAVKNIKLSSTTSFDKEGNHGYYYSTLNSLCPYYNHLVVVEQNPCEQQIIAYNIKPMITFHHYYQVSKVICEGKMFNKKFTAQPLNHKCLVLEYFVLYSIPHHILINLLFNMIKN